MEKQMIFNVEFVYYTNKHRCVVTNDGVNYNLLQAFYYDKDSNKIKDVRNWDVHNDGLTSFFSLLKAGIVKVISCDWMYLLEVLINDLIIDMENNEYDYTKDEINVLRKTRILVSVDSDSHKRKYTIGEVIDQYKEFKKKGE